MRVGFKKINRKKEKSSFRKDLIKLKINLKVLKRVFSYMFEYRFLLFVIAVSSIISSGASIMGTALLKTIVDDYLAPLIKNYNKELINGFVNVLLFIAVLYIIGVITTYLSGRIVVSVVSRTLYKIRIDLFSKMEKLPIGYFDAHKHGELMSLYTNDIETLREMLTQTFTEYISFIIMIVGSFSIMFYYNWQLTLITILVVIFALFVSKQITKKSSEYFTQQQDEIAKLNGFVEEMFEGQKVVKVFCHETETREDFQKINGKLCGIATKASTYISILFPVMANILHINYSLMAVFGGILVIKSVISVGTLMPFLVYTRYIIDPIIDISDQFSNILVALAGAKRIFNVIDRKPEVDEGKITIENEGNSLYFIGENEERKRVMGNIEFKNVSFGYKIGKSILKSINLKANRGEKVALVGSTGAGKTTITSLLNRFYDIQDGKIEFDGIDTKNIRKSDLRKMFSVVLQDTNLFTDTIMENIRYGRLEATDEEVIEASKLSNADKFISNLPDGYKTILSANATNLSQEERQMLSIARAIISNRPVLILDEATSSVDTRTEKLIEDGMNNLIKDKTVFIIAHRLSTTRNSNRIIVLEQGEIIEQGAHEELLENRGRYYQLYNGLDELK